MLSIANEFYIPWVLASMNKDTKRQDAKLHCLLTSVTFSVISHFQQSHNIPKERNFTKFYLEKIGLSKETFKEIEET